jgi:hypothetical protein
MFAIDRLYYILQKHRCQHASQVVLVQSTVYPHSLHDKTQSNLLNKMCLVNDG